MPYDYADVFKQLFADARVLGLNVKRLVWSTARTVPDAIRRTTSGRVEKMKESEIVRRLPRPELDRIWREIEREEIVSRQLAAGVARRAVEGEIEKLARAHADYIARRRRDVGLSFPNALDHVDANGKLTYELLRETLRPVIGQADVADLFRRYQRAALDQRDARGRIEAELIEERAEHGGLASKEDDLPIVRQLADLIDGMQDLRVEPYKELAEIADTIQAARKAVSMSDVARVRPIDGEREPNAKEAFEAATAEYAAEGAGR